ncbi:MAG: hypothetical protein LV481_15495 [Methylacidiphilales bacterium]|nr:hypothetical protein [Candidatus Methylacidiphilales bacterium]
MKERLKKFLQNTANTPLFRLYQALGAPAQWLAIPYLYARRFRRFEDPHLQRCLSEKFPELTVKNGPFRGLRYSEAAAAGSTLPPKLLGSYEMELAPVWARVLQRKYTEIVDIGSAEGYYAVGLGLKFPEARIFAFDTDPAANRLCTEMARLNGVADRLILGSFCDEKVLLGLQLGERALIVSDCEGFEKDLFTPAAARFLARHDLVIEVHDLLNREIATALRERFETTHDILVIESIDDAKKVRTRSYPELDSCDAAMRLFLLSENRHATIEWFWLASKTGAA